MKIPPGFFYSEDHVAVKRIGGNKVRVFLTEYIFSLSEEIEEINISVEQGDEISSGDVIGEVVMPGYVFEIISPVSGLITNVNSEIVEGVDVIYGDGLYRDGWLIEVETNDNLEGQLMSAEQYREFIKDLEG